MRYLLGFLCLILMTLPATAQEWARAHLEKSPRHLEWVKVKHGGRAVQCFVAYPEVKGKAPVVLVIHEIFGLTDWVRLVADQLAAAGYIAIAPDLLSGSAPQGGGTTELGSDEAARKAIAELPPEQITADLKAVGTYGTRLPAAQNKLTVAGFCWGGSQSFRFATDHQALQAAFVFYGTAPEAGLERIACPVYGFYAENDARVNATLDDTKVRMKAAGKSFEPVLYAGAGHGFMRAGAAPEASAANQAGREKGWVRWLELLKKL